MNVNKPTTSTYEDIQAAFRGSIAAFMNILVTFPINKIIFRMQTAKYQPVAVVQGAQLQMQMLAEQNAKSLFSAVVQGLRAEGFSTLYRGVAPPLMQQIVSKGLMFGLYEHYSTVIYKTLLRNNLLSNKSSDNVSRNDDDDNHNNRKKKVMMNDVHRDLAALPPFHRNNWQNRDDCLIGTLAAIATGLTECALTPFERVQSILQMPEYLMHSHYRNTLTTFHSLYTVYGVKEVYRGVSAIALRNALGCTLYFGLRGPMQSALLSEEVEGEKGTTKKKKNAFVVWMNSFLVGAVLGAGISTISYPMNMVKSNMQTHVGDPFRSFISYGMDIAKERGFLGLYTGAPLNIFRAFVSWGIINSTYELLQRLEMSSK